MNGSWLFLWLLSVGRGLVGFYVGGFTPIVCAYVFRLCLMWLSGCVCCVCWFALGLFCLCGFGCFGFTRVGVGGCVSSLLIVIGYFG